MIYCWLRLRKHRWSEWYWVGAMGGPETYEESGYARHCLDCGVPDGWNRPREGEVGQ